MSAYGYAPPPPPPSAAVANHPHPGYGHQTMHHQSRGSSHRGRGGPYAGARNDYHGPMPVNSAGPYQQIAQGQPYPSHAPVAYSSSHHVPASAYPTHQPQWGPEPGHARPVQYVQQHPSAPVAISSSNYHPSYAPQPYPSAQYPQQQSFGPPQQYAAPYQGQPPPNATQWNNPPQPQQAPYGNGRPRGGFQDGTMPKSHPAGPPMRHGFGNEPVLPAVSGSYGQPYPQDPRAVQFTPQGQYPYSAPPPAAAPQRQDGYYGQQGRRGRGGRGRKDGMRGRGGHRGGDRNHDNKPAPVTHLKKSEPPAGGSKKKRKTNTLGLTPGMDSESEDDEGEEKVLTDLIGQEALQVKDIAAFLKERKQHFPTTARVEARKAAELVQSSERKRATSLEKQADKLRRQLRKVEVSIKRKREQGDEGDDMRDPTSDESSDDEQPEVMSTRSHVAPPPPAAKKADMSRHCKYFSTGGTCGKKGKCRFVHDPEVREAAAKEREANNGRLTIRQRLILNDKEQDDLAVLQSIQYLREKGIMTPPAAKDERTDQTSLEKSAPAPSVKSSLPPPSASLPPLPVKREPGSGRRNPPPSIIPGADSISAQGLEHYQGWLLKPYGSSNGKQPNSDDLP